MIGTLLRISWINLRRDRVALLLTFVLPIVFFSIFAAIFGGMGGGGGGGVGSSSMTVIVVDEDASDVSASFVEAFDGQDAIEVERAPRATDDGPEPPRYDRDSARKAVRTGDRDVAVIIPGGFGASFGDFGGGDTVPIDLIYDASNPLAQHTVAGLLQASAMMAAPDVLMEKGLGQLEKFGGALTPEQQAAVDDLLPVLRGEKTWEELTGDADAATDADAVTDGDAGSSGFAGLVQVNAVDVREGEDEGADTDSAPSYSIISYYAAGIGVMFLLFSMVGAASTLLEEEETGTLERVLSSSLGMTRLLAGHWIFYSVVGVAQLAAMFLWGELVFGMDLFTPTHLAGFAVMTAVTAPAAAALGIMLATICKSRAQLSGISTVAVLVMSALGGSMVPKFAMPDFMQTTGKFTFNGWAIDGYLKVFWYDDPDGGVLDTIGSIMPQVAVLCAMIVVFLIVARLLARRWEAA